MDNYIASWDVKMKCCRIFPPKFCVYGKYQESKGGQNKSRWLRIFWTPWKKEAREKIEKNTKHYIRKSEKKCDENKEKISHKCRNIELCHRATEETMKKPLENLLIHRMSEIKTRRHQLFEDHRKDYNVMKRNFASPLIMKDDIRAPIRKMKLSKATSPDSISLEVLKALENCEIDRSQYYSTKSMKQVKFHQTSPNLYL